MCCTRVRKVGRFVGLARHTEKGRLKTLDRRFSDDLCFIYSLSLLRHHAAHLTQPIAQVSRINPPKTIR
ncbi:hypothetical protein [Neisseria sicca]|uniref:hypothetical protein n=1 Tax=Neisseria sicca TaxID=490 RepID=UPI0011BD0C51|nr:hypothetical protein [Neisseria sicca]